MESFDLSLPSAGQLISRSFKFLLLAVGTTYTNSSGSIYTNNNQRCLSVANVTTNAVTPAHEMRQTDPTTKTPIVPFFITENLRPLSELIPKDGKVGGLSLEDTDNKPTGNTMESDREQEKETTSVKAIVLAAGKGTRMKSDLIKVMHPLAGRPVLTYVLDAIRNADIDNIAVVIGHQGALIQEMFKDQNITFVLQKEPKGTGHAVLVSKDIFTKNSKEKTIILSGDSPLIASNTIKELVNHQEQAENSVGTVLTTQMSNPGSYGRIIRDNDGTLVAIKEAKDCSNRELEIKEINTGVYIFKTKELFDALTEVKTENKQGEYYLTDVVTILKAQNKSVAVFETMDSESVMGINTRQDLAQLSKILYRRKAEVLMSQGVTFIDPDQSYVDPMVKIDKDTIIYPFTMIEGETQIGKRCKIMPFVHLKNTIVPDDTVVDRKDSK